MRKPDWLARLNAYLTEIHDRPYDRLTHNCGTFAIGVIQAVSGDGQDVVMKRAGFTYPTTELGLARLLLDRGGMRGLAESFFGTPARTDTASAKRGDLVWCDGIDGDTLGVVENDGAICLTPEGLWRFKMSDVKGFWPL